MSRRDVFDHDEDRPRRRRDRRNVSQATQVVVNVGGTGRSFMFWHVFHFVMSVFTCGLWLPVWFVHFLIWVSSK